MPIPNANAISIKLFRIAPTVINGRLIFVFGMTRAKEWRLPIKPESTSGVAKKQSPQTLSMKYRSLNNRLRESLIYILPQRQWTIASSKRISVPIVAFRRSECHQRHNPRLPSPSLEELAHDSRHRFRDAFTDFILIRWSWLDEKQVGGEQGQREDQTPIWDSSRNFKVYWVLDSIHFDVQRVFFADQECPRTSCICSRPVEA
jgi:hypothetical protein